MRGQRTTTFFGVPTERVISGVSRNAVPGALGGLAGPVASADAADVVAGVVAPGAVLLPPHATHAADATSRKERSRLRAARP
jgi:hypothetical protein